MTKRKYGKHLENYLNRGPKKASLKPYDYKLDIVFEDKDLLIINKSAGISIHPGGGN